MNIQKEQPICNKCSSILGNVFCTLSPEQVTEMSTDKNCSIIKKGQIIYNEGNKPTGIYCIHKGKVKLYQTGKEGKEQILRFAKEDDILGYRALISGDTHSTSASVMEEATICFIPRITFFDFLRINSDLSSKMIRLLSRDLKDAENRLTSLAQKPVRERMAETILMLNEFYGADDEGLINSAVSREDIANIVGTATETTIRILSDFKFERLIEFQGKRIKVKNRKELVKTAHYLNSQ